MEYLRKIGGNSVVQQVIDCLTDAMLNKQLKPGDKIPTEMELAESFGVGRNSVREAIKILVYLGVLEIRRAEGTFVCEGFSDSMIDPMIYGIILDSEDSYDSLMELREMIEIGVMNLAMKKYDLDDLSNVKQQLEKLKEASMRPDYNVEDVFNCDNDFHDAICQMAHNPLVEKINRVVRVLTYAMRLETVKSMLETNRVQEFFDAHLKVYQLLENQEKEQLGKAIEKTYFREILN